MKKILVVEDSSSLRKDILEMLGFEGFEAVGAEDGLIGVTRAREFQPDLIICDIMMPEMDGYQVLDTLRKDSATAVHSSGERPSTMLPLRHARARPAHPAPQRADSRDCRDKPGNDGKRHHHGGYFTRTENP